MKKLIALISIIAILFSIGGESIVLAKETNNFVVVDISNGEHPYYEKVIVEDGEIYLLAENFSRYTNYEPISNKNSLCFLIKGQAEAKSTREIIINPDKKTATIKSISTADKKISLQNCFVSDEKVYLPLCQMLPMMNASIFGVEGGKIQIANNPISLLEILYDFDIRDYYFNLSSEFLDNDVLAVGYILPAYLYDSVIGFKWKRVTPMGEYEDFQDIFEELLLENDIYLDTLANSPSSVDKLIQQYKKINDASKNSYSVFDWIKEAGETDISDKTGGILLTTLKEFYAESDLEYGEIYQLTDAWNEKWGNSKFSFSKCVDIINYAYNCAKINEERYKMLDAVYDIKKGNPIGNEEKAAHHVYDLYKNQAGLAIADETLKSLINEAVENITCPKIYFITLECTKLILDEILPFDASDVSTLHLLSSVVLTAERKYQDTSFETQQDAETKRLSLLFCALASKKCYSIMGSTSLYSSDKYYKHKIEQLNELIVALSVAKDSVRFDSYDNLSTFQKENLSKLKENPPKYQDFSADLPEGSIGNLFNISSFEKSAFLKSKIASTYTVDSQHLYTLNDDVEANGWISSAILKYGWNGTAEKIVPDCHINNMIYHEGFLYVSNIFDGIMKLDTNGKLLKTLYSGDDVISFCISEKYIYFLRRNNNNFYLCRIDLKGQNLKIYDWVNGQEFIYADDNNIYLLNTEYVGGSSFFNIVKFDTESKKVTRGEPHQYTGMVSAVSDGKKIYICTSNYNQNAQVFRCDMNLSNNELELFSTGSYKGLTLCGDKLILSPAYQAENVEVIDLKNNKKSSLAISDTAIKDQTIGRLDVLGDYAIINPFNMGVETVVCKLTN